MPKEPPGPRALQEFIDSLGGIAGVDEAVATVLRDLHARGELKATAIVAALRGARRGREQVGDETPQA
jgi:hypothetical protein